MYRCYLIHHGRIASCAELAAATLDEAIARGRVLLAADPDTRPNSGIEIWHLATLLHSDKCHAAETGRLTRIVSPFAISQSAVLPD
jgi:hypothetical protein